MSVLTKNRESWTESEREKFLDHLYFAFRHLNGWLVKLETMFDLNQANILYLEDLDDLIKLGERDAERHFAGQQWEWDIGVLQCETDEEKINHLSRKIVEAYENYTERARDGVAYKSNRLALALSNVDKMKKLRNRIRARTCHKNESVFSLTESEIIFAREVPLEKLVEVNRYGYAWCPFGEHERQKLWVKNGWGFCFPHGQSCDSIGWVMQTKGMKFHDAIRYLNRV